MAKLGNNRSNQTSSTKPSNSGNTMLKRGRVVTIRETGNYPSSVSKIELGQRPNSYQGGKMVPCFRFEFSPDGMAEGETPFLLQTGVEYGSKSALLTQVIDSIVGRPLEDSEIERLDVTRLTGQRVIVGNEKETPEDSEEPINRIGELSREDSEPLDLKPLLAKK